MSNLSKTLFVFPVDPENLRSAWLTIAAYRIILKSRNDLSLLVETEKRRDEISQDLLDELCRNWGAVFIADRNFKSCVSAELVIQRLPVLFDPDGWNYNDPMNAALAIAKIAGCAFAMRLDVDTLPDLDFETLVEEQTNMLARKERAVVGTTYKERYGLRSELVPPDIRPDYFELVRSYTGIDPYHQLTAGAAMTQASPGYPGVCFKNQKVFGIDDADFSTRLGRRAGLSTPGRIYRSAPGRSLEAREYAARLARMVVVRALRNQANFTDALCEAHEFLEKLEDYFVLKGRSNFGGAVALRDIEEISEGLANFEELSSKWHRLVDVVCDLNSGLPSDCSCHLTAERR